jgi:hypothetical protein
MKQPQEYIKRPNTWEIQVYVVKRNENSLVRDTSNQVTIPNLRNACAL